MRRIALPVGMVMALALASPVLGSGGAPTIVDLRAGPHTITVHNDSPRLGTGPNLLTVEIPTLRGGDVELQLEGPGGQIVRVPLQALVYLDGPPDSHDIMAEHVHGDAHDAVNDTHATTDAQHGAVSDPHSAVDDHHAAPAPVSSAPSVPLPRALQRMGLAQTASAAEASEAERAMPGMTDDHAAASSQGHSPVQAADDHAQMTPAQMAAHGSAATSHGTSDMGSADGHSSGAQATAPTSNPTGEGFFARGTARLDITGTWVARIRIHAPEGELLTASAPLDVVDGGPNPLYLATTGLLMGGSLLFGVIQRRRELLRGR